MDSKILKKISKKFPSIARGLEILCYSFIVYALTLILSGGTIDQQSLLQACIPPLLAFFGKYRRDLENKI
jgi:hypothetical protein